jgi:hypothetical protein
MTSGFCSADSNFEMTDYYFLRHQIHRRAEDCIHWDMTGHRRITKLVLTHIAQTWDIKLPKHIKMNCIPMFDGMD